MKGIRRALVLTTSERYLILVANFLTLAIISRLLTPAEIGISVLGMAISMLALSVREFASTNFLIQRKELKLEDVRATFTILVLVTAAISFLIMISAGGIGALYDEPKLTPYLQVIALWILVQTIAAPVSALLRREMAFGKLAIINITGAILCSGFTITFAAVGLGYMSIAWALLASETAVACLCILIWPDRSIFKPCLGAWRSMLAFGGYNGANVLLYKIYESLPYVALGRFLSAESLALYNRGVTICQLPDRLILGGVVSVLLSAFSAEVRNGRGLRDHYLRAIELITAVQWPALILLAILADPVVRVVLGDQWLDAVPLVRIMAIGSLFSFSAELNYPVLVAVGAMRDLLMRSLIAWPISALVISCAAYFGLKAAALSWFITLPFQAFISIYFVRKHIDLSWRDIASALFSAALLALCTAAGPLLVVVLLDGQLDFSISVTFGIILLGLIGWGLGLWLLGHPLLQEIEHAAMQFIGSLRRFKHLSLATRWQNSNR